MGVFGNLIRIEWFGELWGWKREREREKRGERGFECV